MYVKHSAPNDEGFRHLSSGHAGRSGVAGDINATAGTVFERDATTQPASGNSQRPGISGKSVFLGVFWPVIVQFPDNYSSVATSAGNPFSIGT